MVYTVEEISDKSFVEGMTYRVFCEPEGHSQSLNSKGLKFCDQEMKVEAQTFTYRLEE